MNDLDLAAILNDGSQKHSTDATDNRVSAYAPVWSSEKECQAWLADKLDKVKYLRVYEEVSVTDIYGRKGRIDLGLVLPVAPHRERCFVAIELKNKTHISANACDAFVQAYHYREFCSLTDDRLPDDIYGSPALAFAGVFDRMAQCDYQRERFDGMCILACQQRVGSVRCNNSRWNDEISFHMGEQLVFAVNIADKSIRWTNKAEDYVYGREKRNGSRRVRQSVAERFAEMESTIKELF